MFLQKCIIVDTLCGGLRVDWHSESKIEAKEGLDRNRCRKIEYITIPYSKDSRSNTDGLFVSS